MDQIRVIAEGDVLVELGYSTVHLVKMFGPMIFCDLKIHPDPASGEWIISRQMGGEYDDDGSFVRETWQEWTRIPGQLPGDFRE